MVEPDLKRVLILAPSFDPAVASGGPARSLTNLVDQEAGSRELHVLAPDRDLGATEPFPGLSGRTVDRGGATVQYVNTSDNGALFAALKSACGRRWDAIILNSFWNARLALLPAVMTACGLLRAETLVLMPRGELETGALLIKPRKKRWAMDPYRLVYRHAVDVFGSTSDSETANIRRLFPEHPVLVTDNEPDVIAFGGPSPDDSPDPPDSGLRILFLGRVNEKKGLLELLKALQRSPAQVSLTIAGPVDGRAYWNRCREEVSRLPNSVTVNYVGPINRLSVHGFLHNSDLLVALTSGENFGHTIAEALQAGCPVLGTAETPWTETLRSGGGWVATDRDDSTEIATLIMEVACLTREGRSERRLMARRAYEEWAKHRPANIIEQALAWRLTTPKSQ